MPSDESSKTTLRRLDSASFAITSQRYSALSNQIIEPLASRCVKYRFKAIPSSQQISRLQYVSQQESVQVDEAGLQQLYLVSGGDLRKSINMLQSAATLYDKVVDKKVVDEISGVSREMNGLGNTELRSCESGEGNPAAGNTQYQTSGRLPYTVRIQRGAAGSVMIELDPAILGVGDEIEP